MSETEIKQTHYEMNKADIVTENAMQMYQNKKKTFENEDDYIFETRGNPWLKSKFCIMKNLIIAG
jgi:hypothetical protein